MSINLFPYRRLKNIRKILSIKLTFKSALTSPWFGSLKICPLMEHLTNSIRFCVKVPVLSLNTYLTWISLKKYNRQNTKASSSFKFVVFTVIGVALEESCMWISHSINLPWNARDTSRVTIKEMGIRKLINTKYPKRSNVAVWRAESLARFPRYHISMA